MTFALVIYAQLWALPIIVHGYIDKAECERAATFINNPVIQHACIPEHGQ